jgi:hypothetical protein
LGKTSLSLTRFLGITRLTALDLLQKFAHARSTILGLCHSKTQEPGGDYYCDTFHL